MDIFSQTLKGQTLKKTDSLLLQNAKFYEAFERNDLETLYNIWSHSETVKCIHPGWSILEGWEAVRESWENIFRSENDMRVSLRNVCAEVRGKFGIVTLVEEITYTTATSIRTGAIMATNLFEYDGDEWKMIHHHGSPLMIAEQQETDEKYRYN